GLSGDAHRDGSSSLGVQYFLLVEAGTAVCKKVPRREISTREATQALDLLMTSALDLRPSGPLLPRALGLAVRLRHPVYDCVYLALAHGEGAALVTADRRLLARAASRLSRLTVIDLATL